MSFSNFGGGLVNTIVAGAGNDISTGLVNQLTSNISFSVGDVLAGAVQNASGYALNEGANYLTSQVNSLVPTSIGNGLANAVATQVATVGINAVKGFAQQSITNLLAGGNAPLVGLQSGATANKGTISVPMSVVEQLPNAEYGGSVYNLQPDVVFTIVPANAGPQTQAPPQTFPYTEADVFFDPKYTGADLPGIKALKGTAALAGPGSGSVFTASPVSAGFIPKDVKFDATAFTGAAPIKGYW
jgi:hypothetical protein